MVQRLLAFVLVAIALIGAVPDARAQQWNANSQGLPDLTRIPLHGNDVHVFRHQRFPINRAPFDPEMREWFRVFGQLGVRLDPKTGLFLAHGQGTFPNATIYTGPQTSRPNRSMFWQLPHQTAADVLAANSAGRDTVIFLRCKTPLNSPDFQQAISCLDKTLVLSPEVIEPHHLRSGNMPRLVVVERGQMTQVLDGNEALELFTTHRGRVQRPGTVDRRTLGGIAGLLMTGTMTNDDVQHRVGEFMGDHPVIAFTAEGVGVILDLPGTAAREIPFVNNSLSFISGDNPRDGMFNRLAPGERGSVKVAYESLFNLLRWNTRDGWSGRYESNANRAWRERQTDPNGLLEVGGVPLIGARRRDIFGPNCQPPK